MFCEQIPCNSKNRKTTNHTVDTTAFSGTGFDILLGSALFLSCHKALVSNKLFIEVKTK